MYKEVKHVRGLDTTNLYLANIRVVGHRLEVRKGMVLWWGEGKAYSGISTQTLLGEISYWDDISPKRGRMSRNY